MKGLINIKSSNNKCFLWFHIRHLTPLKIHPEKIGEPDKNMANYLDYKGIEFPVFKTDFRKVEKRYIFALMCFAMKITWFILFINQMKHLKIVWIY